MENIQEIIEGTVKEVLETNIFFKNYLTEEKDEVTYHQFVSQLKNFLRDILIHPVKSELGDFFKSKGFTKGKMIEYLTKSEIIIKTEKINLEDPENVSLDISYLIPKKGFERKVQKMYIKLFDLREDNNSNL